MKPKKRQKLCYNCDAEADLDVIVCPFCAADLRAEKVDSHLTQPLQSPKSSSIVEEAREGGGEERKTLLLALSFCTLGMQLLILGLLMGLFAVKGVLTLKWDANYWFLYLFFSVPCLYFGYRAASRTIS